MTTTIILRRLGGIHYLLSLGAGSGIPELALTPFFQGVKVTDGKAQRWKKAKRKGKVMAGSIEYHKSWQKVVRMYASTQTAVLLLWPAHLSRCGTQILEAMRKKKCHVLIIVHPCNEERDITHPDYILAYDVVCGTGYCTAIYSSPATGRFTTRSLQEEQVRCFVSKDWVEARR